MVLKMENGGKCTAKWFLKWKMGFSGRRVGRDVIRKKKFRYGMPGFRSRYGIKSRNNFLSELPKISVIPKKSVYRATCGIPKQDTYFCKAVKEGHGNT